MKFRPQIGRQTSLASFIFTMSLCGCTSISVQPMQPPAFPTKVCIENNPKVIIRDFVPVLREGIERHNMTSEVFDGNLPAYCGLKLSYTALQSWDFTTYLSHAELWLEQNGKQVGYAEYHLIGGGGLSLMKWQGTKTKMDPVIDKLFAGD